MTAEIALRDVRAGYGPLEVLHGLWATFPAGSVTAVIGHNGAGKTTALRVIAGTVPALAGTVLWGGEDVHRFSVAARARRGMILIPQQNGTFDQLSVRENLQVFSGGAGFDAALEAFPALASRLGQRAGTLSGGEQQMLALSRALVRDARVLLVDEISAGLAPQAVARLYEVITGLARSGLTVILVEQYVAAVLRHADVVYVLRRGEISFAGEPVELSGDRLRAVFD